MRRFTINKNIRLQLEGNLFTIQLPADSAFNEVLHHVSTRQVEVHSDDGRAICLAAKPTRLFRLNTFQTQCQWNTPLEPGGSVPGADPAYAIPGGYAGLIDSILGISGRGIERLMLSGLHSLDRPVEAVFYDPKSLAPIDWLPFINQHCCGLVRHDDPTNVVPLKLIRDAILAWPNARMVIVTNKRATMRKAARFLDKEAHRPVDQWFAGTNNLLRTGVCVATPACFDDAIVSDHMGRGPSFIFYLDPPDTQEYGVFCDMAHIGSARVFGFLRDQPLRQQQIDKLLGWFGMHGLRVTRKGKTRRDIAVGLIKNVSSGGARQQDSMTELLRKGVWHNQKRNALAMKLALQVATGDLEWLSTLVPGANFGPGRLRVGIIVANITQALAVASSVHDWPIRARQPVEFEGLSNRAIRLLESRLAMRKRKSTGLIVTSAAFEERTSPFKFDIVVRLDGGTGMLPLDWADDKRQDLEPLPTAVIVDFWDKTPWELKKRAQQRETEYQTSWDCRMPKDFATKWDAWLCQNRQRVSPRIPYAFV